MAQEDVTKTLSDALRTLWPLVDNLGTVRDLAKQDGTIAVHYIYDTYGNVTSGDTSLTRYLFTSRELDTATDLQYNRARWYDAEVGRWLSEDPIGLVAGDANVGRYVGNEVTDVVDPSGLWGWDNDFLQYGIGGLGGFFGAGAAGEGWETFADGRSWDSFVGAGFGAVDHVADGMESMVQIVDPGFERGSYAVEYLPDWLWYGHAEAFNNGMYVGAGTVRVEETVLLVALAVNTPAFLAGAAPLVLGGGGAGVGIGVGGSLIGVPAATITIPGSVWVGGTVAIGVGGVAGLAPGGLDPVLGHLFDPLEMRGVDPKSAPARGVDITPNRGARPGPPMSIDEAIDELRRGGDVFWESRDTARRIAEQAGDGSPIWDPPHGPGQNPHWHPTIGGERAAGHVLY